VAVRVQRLARQLLATTPEQLYLKQVVTVVVGCYQGEALADELALIDGQVRELRRGDATPRNQRVPPDEGHRCDRVAMPPPGADQLLAQIQLPAGVSHRRLFGEVEVTGEHARLYSLTRRKEYTSH